MDAAIADEAARIRRHTHLRLSDAIQAATAIRHDLKLMTRGTRDFRVDRFSRRITADMVLEEILAHAREAATYMWLPL